MVKLTCPPCATLHSLSFFRKMFTGEYNHTIDQKGRMIIPNKFRNLLGDSFVVTKGIDECLEIYDLEVWSKWEDKIISLPYSNPIAREFKRKIIGRKEDLSPDKMGRVQIPIALRNLVGLTSDITFVGVGDHIEVWDKDKFDKKNNFDDSDDMSRKMEGLGI